MADAQIFGIVIYKLGYWQEPSLVILFKIDRNLKINLYDIVLPLYLAVYQRIKNGKKLLLMLKK